MMTKETRKALIEWEPISSRLITASFRTNNRRVKAHIIQCYAPTNDAVDDVRARFYDSLNHLLGRVGARDLGDFNTKIGGRNEGYEEVMGKHGVGKMNENGEMYVETCVNNNLVIGGSVFPHKTIHKTTWVSPDHVTENQIDHIFNCRKFRRFMEDVRTRRGADAASDHHLLSRALCSGDAERRERLFILFSDRTAILFRDAAAAAVLLPWLRLGHRYRVRRRRSTYTTTTTPKHKRCRFFFFFFFRDPVNGNPRCDGAPCHDGTDFHRMLLEMWHPGAARLAGPGHLGQR
ncbi:hypothetical protein NHX12_027457 [Muraenolepis orangiensis]|uniref:Uncharacterized protein n=1 Tax=Muraenolepis orangiensis TaxID=630683 RepID=A0A9Q0IP92_9TELE|nr:hypothetical protein NHX12_027457 [Muraenolepis orangiensis]